MSGLAALGVVQCRMASTRLPGKALADLDGRPVLEWALRRAQACRALDRVVLATTTGPEDDPVAALGRALGLPVVRGEADNVLARFAAVLAAHPARCVVRITADNPFTDPASVERVVRHFLAAGLDYCYAARIPYGAGADAFPGELLAGLHRHTADPRHREHINTWFLDNHLGLRIGCVDPPPGCERPDARLTVDTARDLERARALAARLNPDPEARLGAGLAELIDAYDRLRAEE
jgi:spore coat polysaccharide biosynthesis protein SpsF